MRAERRVNNLRPSDVKYYRDENGHVYTILKNAIKTEAKKVSQELYRKPSNPKNSFVRKFDRQFGQIKRAVPPQQTQQNRQISPQQLQPQPQPRAWNPFEHKDVEEFFPSDNFSDGVYLKFFDLSNKRGGGRTGECFGI